MHQWSRHPLSHIITMSCLLASSFSFALDPAQGWYGGLMLGVNYAPEVNLKATTPLVDSTTPITATISYNYLGDVGGQFGYRFDNWRTEAQFLYNYSPYNGLTVGNVFVSANTVTSRGVQFQGSTTTYGLLFNGIYDFYTLEDAAHFIPYVGVGIGGELVENELQFNRSGAYVGRRNFNNRNYNFAAQAILGLSYYWDDCTSLSLDARYLTGNQITYNGLFGSVTVRPQIYMLNLVFNTALNI